MYVAMATIQLFGLFLNTRIFMFFKCFHLGETFCGITFYALEIISLIKANIGTVIMERVQKIILPKYGHKH